MCRGASHGSRSSLIPPLAIAVLFATLLTTPSRLALAATKNVDIGNSSCNDGTGVPAFCHIQPAITAANPGDQISIAAGTYFENLSISKNISVSATSTDAAQTIVDGNGTDQAVVLIGVGVTVDISNVTIRNANHVSGEAGGVNNLGTLTLSNVVVRDNFATNGGSGIDNNSSTVTLINSIVEANRTDPAIGGGGGISNGNLFTIIGSRIRNNMASDGAGIVNAATGTMTLSNSSVDNNTSTGNGGGIRNDGSLEIRDSGIIGNKTGDSNNIGGGIFNNSGSLTIFNTRVVNNSATSAGGGIYHGGGTLTLSDSTVGNNKVSRIDNIATGGGIWNGATATLNHTLVERNTVVSKDSYGGGIYNNYASTLTLNNSSVSRNTISGALTVQGGAISALNGGAVMINNSTVDGNSISCNASCNDLQGAGILFNGPQTVAKVMNSTISNNIIVASNLGVGGGISASIGNLILANTTVSGNTAPVGGGGIYYGSSTTGITLTNTIVANNTSYQFGSSPPASDCSGSGAMTSLGYNLIGDTFGCNFISLSSDQVGSVFSPINPQLGPLQDNDGPAPTQALLPGSPALDAGNPAQPGSGGAACLVTDQRGVSRPAGARCDIGAYEAIPLGQVGTLAGTPGVPGAANGPGPVAQFNGPSSISLNRDSTIALIADTQNSTIRKLEVTAGVASTLAGLAGQIGSTDGITTEARFNHPQGVALSRDGSFGLVADTGNHTIRKVIVATGHVTRLAGFPGLAGSDNGTGAAARFNLPTGVALSGDGSFALVADNGNHTIRKLIVATGEVTTLAGSPGNPGKSDGVGAEATFTSPSDLGLSANGKIALVAEGDGDLATGQTMTGLRVRKIETATGRVTTVTILSACNSIRIQANSGRIMGIAPTGDASVVLVANGLNGTILAVTVATGESRLVAGSECVPGADNGVGSAARFRNPLGIALTSNGSTALVADTENHTIRRIDGVLQRRFLSILLR
jgi:hypothetical protein